MNTITMTSKDRKAITDVASRFLREGWERIGRPRRRLTLKGVVWEFKIQRGEGL